MYLLISWEYSSVCFSRNISVGRRQQKGSQFAVLFRLPIAAQRDTRKCRLPYLLHCFTRLLCADLIHLINPGCADSSRPYDIYQNPIFAQLLGEGLRQSHYPHAEGIGTPPAGSSLKAY